MGKLLKVPNAPHKERISLTAAAHVTIAEDHVPSEVRIALRSTPVVAGIERTNSSFAN